jgi:hypothetical protein
MEEMIDISSCPCGASVYNNNLNLVPLLIENKHQIQCSKCGRRGIISDDIDLVCLSWNTDASLTSVKQNGLKDELEEYRALGTRAQISAAMEKLHEVVKSGIELTLGVKLRDQIIEWLLIDEDRTRMTIRKQDLRKSPNLSITIDEDRCIIKRGNNGN